MPAFITHDLFARSVYKLMPVGTGEDELCAFLWGAQGPDLLFFNKTITILPVLALHMHKQKYAKFLQTCLEMAKQSQDSLYMAYFYGLVCHYVLDVSMHPYIFALQNRLQKKGASIGVHNRIESDIDTDLYRLMENRRIDRYRMNDLRNEYAFYRKMSKFIKRAIGKVYGVPLSTSRISASFLCADILVSRFKEKDSLLRLSIKRIDQLTGKPYGLEGYFRRQSPPRGVLNLAHVPWRGKDGALHTQSVPDLFEMAIDQMRILTPRIEQMWQKGQNIEELFVQPYDAGRF